MRNDVGEKLQVIFGGGRRQFLPIEVEDESGKKGSRTDKQNLIDEWKNKRERRTYVTNKEDLLKIDPKVDYQYLGLFDNDHCPYYLESNLTINPTLTEMTEKAIQILSQSDNGYFLFVEGGRIE